MVTGKTLNAANLEALGAARLATLLLEVTAGDAAAKRQLRLALAGRAGPGEAAREVGKRLASIARARSYIEWHQVKTLALDLEAQLRAILELVAPGDPRGAFDLVWRLVECADGVFARSDDGNGVFSAVFAESVKALGPLAQAARLDPEGLAERSFTALRNDGYGAWDTLVEVLAPSLGPKGLGRLKQLAEAWQAEAVVVPPERERRVIGWSSSGKIYADEMEASHRRCTTTMILKQVADALGDVDSYIAHIESGARNMPLVAADIARRLLDAGRPEEAWAALEAVEAGHRLHNAMEWEQARVDTLEALGRREAAQAFRWERFLATLNATHLRDYLSKLPDFEDFDAEQRALTHALGLSNVHQALAFLVAWPDLHRASQLVVARAQDLNGDVYELLSPAADALEDKYPLAAILLRRSMIDFTLKNARSSRYKHAAQHFSACAGLAARVADFGGVPDHAAFERALRATHGKKLAFWQAVGASG